MRDFFSLSPWRLYNNFFFLRVEKRRYIRRSQVEGRETFQVLRLVWSTLCHSVVIPYLEGVSALPYLAAAKAGVKVGIKELR